MSLSSSFPRRKGRLMLRRLISSAISQAQLPAWNLRALIAAGLIAVAGVASAQQQVSPGWAALSSSLNRAAVALAQRDQHGLVAQADAIENALHEIADARAQGRDSVPLERWRETEQLSHAFVAATRQRRLSDAGALLLRLRTQVRLIAPSTRPPAAR